MADDGQEEEDWEVGAEYEVLDDRGVWLLAKLDVRLRLGRGREIGRLGAPIPPPLPPLGRLWCGWDPLDEDDRAPGS